MAPRDRWAPLYTTATMTLGSSTTILEQVANLSVLGDEGKSEEENVALPLRGTWDEHRRSRTEIYREPTQYQTHHC